jgi:rhodanese-related sulfurtransferase
VTTTTVHPADLRASLDAGERVHVVDVRTPAEHESARIPGSHNLPLDALDDVTDHLADADAPLVFVCRSGARASQAAERLAGAAPDVAVLDGGLQAWEAGAHPTTRGRQRWDLERQVRLVAGGIVATSVLASTKAPAAKWVAGAVGAGLTFAAISNTCAMARVLSKLPYNRDDDHDPVAAARELRSA